MTGRLALLGGQGRSWHRDMTGRLTGYRLQFPPSLSSAGKVMQHPLPCVSATFEECVPMTDMNDPVGMDSGASWDYLSSRARFGNRDALES